MSTYRLVRDIEVDQRYDLVIAGGGPGGTMAAISAGRLGAKVLLLEATGCLGGMGTSGLVTAFDPMANGEEMLVGGIMREVVYRLWEQGELGPGQCPERFAKRYMRWTPFRVEGYKRVLDEMVVEAGVEVRFFTKMIDVDADRAHGTVNGLVVHNIEGYRYIPARTFVDATGDAVLSDLAGVECREAGRDTPHIMPATMASLLAGVDWTRYNREQCHALYQEALDRGEFEQYDRHLVGLSPVGDDVSYLNGGHLFNLNALRCCDLTEGAMLGRRLAKEMVRFYRKHVPGCEKVEHVTTASLLGIRESRRIIGMYELKVEDYFARRHFPEQIGLFNKFIDIHPYDTSDNEWERFQQEHHNPELRLNEGESFGIPYGILVPKGWKNLWVAGRCASADVRVHGVIRVQPAAAMMGQAAGTAAVQSMRTGVPGTELDTERLVETLREHGANLPQAELAAGMTLV